MEKVTKIKTSLSVLILAIALVTLYFSPVGLGHSNPEAGIILDFGKEDDVFYGIVDDLEDPNAIEALYRTCSMYGFPLEEEGGIVTSINNIESEPDGRKWSLYAVELPETDTPIKKPWKISVKDPSDVKISSYAAVAWAFCSDTEYPSNAVDASGKSIYGYGRPDKIVSLAPSCTEMICAVGGERKIVGTDAFSNYPESIKSAREIKKIDDIGGFTNPNYEKIINLNPDLVVCVNSQYSHNDITKKLRSIGINVVVVDGGESINSVLESLIMVGTSMGIREHAVSISNDIKDEISELDELIENNSSVTKNVMVSLSVDNAPWVSGSDTYASDALNIISAENSYGDLLDWAMVSSESLIWKNLELEITREIDTIIVILEEGPDTEAKYRTVLDQLSEEWKRTNAYNEESDEKEIYFLTGSAADLASRPGPRVAQFIELTARIVQKTAFDEDIPKFIGNDYQDYLTMTKNPVTDGII